MLLPEFSTFMWWLSGSRRSRVQSGWPLGCRAAGEPGSDRWVLSGPSSTLMMISSQRNRVRRKGVWEEGKMEFGRKNRSFNENFRFFQYELDTYWFVFSQLFWVLGSNHSGKSEFRGQFLPNLVKKSFEEVKATSCMTEQVSFEKSPILQRTEIVVEWKKILDFW